MDYPVQIVRSSVNAGGNVSASGYYRSSETQRLANMLPPWMHLRENSASIGQQFLSPSAMELRRLENTMNDLMRSKFITTARVDERDVLYKTILPSYIDITDASASGIRCVAAPDGCSPSGVSQIWVAEVNSLREFYYDVLPTRIEISSSGDFEQQVSGIGWSLSPSGVIDLDEKYVDVWGKSHDITWCASNGYYRKQDAETMEDYETYPIDPAGSVLGLDFYNGILWSIVKYGSDYTLKLISPKTQIPKKQTLDELASFSLTSSVELEPSGIIASSDGTIKICDTGKTRIFNTRPAYDYFILDRDNRNIYFREDYRDSGVFISNT